MSAKPNSTEISTAVFDRVADPLEAMDRLGKAIAKSHMFGCENEDQGKVLAMACVCENENPISLARKYNIICGNLSMKYDRMLAEFRGRGGKHRVVCRTAEEASIELKFESQTLVESLTWKEAEQEPFVYMKDEKTLKKNWRTPRARRQTLWARVVSEGVRTLCPEIVAGCYTPEEVDGYTVEAAEPTGTPRVDAEELMRQVADQDNSTEAIDANVVDAEFRPAEAEPEVEPEPKPDVVEGDSTPGQREELRKLFDKAGATDVHIRKALNKRGCEAFRQLTSVQADELIAALQSKVESRSKPKAEPPVEETPIDHAEPEESRQPADTTSSHVTGPVSQTIIDKIKSKLRGEPELVRAVKERLAAHGKTKVAELSIEDCDLLLSALEMGDIEIWAKKELDDSAVPF